MTTIRTSHVGSLPRTDTLLKANQDFVDGSISSDQLAAIVTEETDNVVARQKEIGIDIVNDGEYGHAMTKKVDYGAWWSYSFERFSGLEVLAELPAHKPTPEGKLELDAMGDRRDWNAFADAYSDPTSGIHLASDAASEDHTPKGASESAKISAPVWPTVTGEIEYTGQDIVNRDIAALKNALEKAGKPVTDGFIASLSPAAAARIGNQYYDNDEEAVWAWAKALREEYKAITEAGLTVQIDAPDLAESWDQFKVEPSIEQYREFSKARIDALNWALEGIDPAQVRYHVCWGSWHGPHSTDLEFKYIVDLALSVHADGLTFEAANARHEHEWKIWKDIDLPENKYLIPGVVSHATNVIEHPELVADRIERFASIVGADRVVASTDCGMGGRVHPHIGWAKLETLARGAQLASERLSK